MTDHETGELPLDASAELYSRAEGNIMAYFEDNTTADWVLIGNDTEEIIGGGPDDDYPETEEIVAGWEEAHGQQIHIFSRPADIGLDRVD